jgi:kinesin family protein 20
LTLIDLAGSERTKHTQTSGARLKEAGAINKSLMVLGQCMEVMRANQRRVAAALGGPREQRADTRDARAALALVPFRHSKLTEVLQDYLVGDGRTVRALSPSHATFIMC